MAVSVIPNVFEVASQSTKWVFGKRCKFPNDVPDNLTQPAVTWVIGIRLADMFPPGVIDIATLTSADCDYRVVGPHDGGQVRRKDVHRITLLCSPKPATAPQERQVQQLNYETFISTMASIIKKYGADILM